MVSLMRKTLSVFRCEKLFLAKKLATDICDAIDVCGRRSFDTAFYATVCRAPQVQ
jgi:hypothetical protein